MENLIMFFNTYLPIMLIAIFCGISTALFKLTHYLEKNKTIYENIIATLAQFVETSVIAILCFLLLGYFTDITNEVKMGISGSVAFIGIDKIKEIMDRIINKKFDITERKD